MLLIPCPWCGERPENEFRYGGEAHIARPARSGLGGRRGVGRIPLHARAIRRGVHAERWRHIHGCGRFFNCVRDTVSDRIARHLQARRDTAAMTAAVPHAGRRPDRPRRSRSTSRFDGRASDGCQGDTLASALLANGVHLVGRSFKYHRPRGILSAGSEEPNALVTIDRGAGRDHAEPARDADRALRRAASAQPESLSIARVSISARSPARCRRCCPAGFYYKTFMWPRVVLAAPV